MSNPGRGRRARITNAEALRLRAAAVRLLERGLPPAEVARRFDRSESWGRWVDRVRGRLPRWPIERAIRAVGELRRRGGDVGAVARRLQASPEIVREIARVAEREGLTR